MKALIGRLFGAQNAGGKAQGTGFAMAASRTQAPSPTAQRGAERRRRDAASVSVERRMKKVDRRAESSVELHQEAFIDVAAEPVLMTGTDTTSVPLFPPRQTTNSVTTVDSSAITKNATPRHEPPALALVSSGGGRSDTTKGVLSYGQVVAELGRRWRGCLGGLVAHEQSKSFVVLDMTCAQVALLCTQEVLGSAHFKAVKLRVETEWRFSIAKVLVGTPETVETISKESTGHASTLDFDRRYLQVYDDLFEAAIATKASDIHLESSHGRAWVKLRIYGRLRPWLDLHEDMMLNCIGAAFGSRGKMSTATKEQFASTVPVAFMTSQIVNNRQWEGRYNGRPTVTGYKGVFRLLESTMKVEDIPTLSDLGYSPSQVSDLEQALARQWGMIVIVGSTGSGKSTTLRTMLVHLKDADQLAIYTCESPVEYEIPAVSQFSLPVDVNLSKEEMTGRFTALLRDVVRMDPDVLMVGEIRDAATGEQASDFTLTGHRCFTTVHGAGASNGLDRMTGKKIGIAANDVGGEEFLNLAVYQKLLPRLCPHCKVPANHAVHGLPKAKRETLQTKFRLDIGSMFVANPNGCIKCKPEIFGLPANGTNGVAVAAEIFIPTEEMRSLMREGAWTPVKKKWRSLRRADFASEDCRGKTAQEHALWLASQGVVSIKDFEAIFEPLETLEVLPIKNEADE